MSLDWFNLPETAITGHILGREYGGKGKVQLRQRSEHGEGGLAVTIAFYEVGQKVGPTLVDYILTADEVSGLAIQDRDG